MSDLSRKQTEVRIAEGVTLSEASGQIGKGEINLRTESANLRFSMTDLEKHMLFLGAIGSGKTNAIFQLVDEIRNYMTNQDVMIIFDTKGDYIKEFYKTGDAVIANKTDDDFRYVYWNVFKDIRFKAPKNISEPANEISRTLFDEISSKSKDVFFPYAARDVTGACLVALLKRFFTSVKDGHPIDLTNEDIRRYLYNADIKELKSLIESDPEVKGALQFITLESSAQTQGVLSTIKVMVQDLFSGGFGTKGDFSIRQFIQEKKGRVLFIEYDIDSGRILTPIYRMLFDLAIKEALSRKRAEGNVFFIIDEFALLPNLYHIENGINFGRSLGVKFIVGAQSVPQISTEYGKDRAQSILSGFGTVFAFRVFDRDSRNLIQQRYGANRKIIRTFSFGSGNKTANEQSVNSKVIEDWDLAGLNQGEAIACFYAGKPYRIKFELYSKRSKD